VAEEVMNPGEWEKVYKWIEGLLGHEIPNYIRIPIAVLLLVAISVSILLVIISGVSKISEIVTEKLLPKIYRREQKAAARSRRLFAEHLAREINTTNSAENWRDAEFAELEAEVEAEGALRSWTPWKLRHGIRRERSLSVALQRSAERLVLVEGDPGAGKSVALRHIALEVATRAARSQRLHSVLPVYVNLKSLRRDGATPIDRALIRSCVVKCMNRINDRFVDEFLNANFDEGIVRGTWLFLFDSFDEIPDVLSSTESDDTVALYSAAISDFLGGMNACRGVMASRFYRGPAAQGWRKFRVMELTPKRQRTLVSKALIVKPRLADQLMTDVASAPDDVQAMARNPMLLGLLCEHVRLGNPFPGNVFDVFSKYISHRLARDEARVKERYQIDHSTTQTLAEQIAFSMTADQQIGLNPTRSELLSALQRQGFRHSKALVIRALDAMEYMKLGRQEMGALSTRDPQFTFAHRRFQEYFATSVVISDPSRIQPRALLQDARWRETAVVICQTAQPSDLDPLFAEVMGILEEAQQYIAKLAHVSPQASSHNSASPFAWPKGILHVLGILQDGFSARIQLVPQDLRIRAGQIVTVGFRQGDLLDQKYALSNAGMSPEPDLLELLRSGLGLSSQMINDVIFRQVARLSNLPEDILRALRLGLLRICMSGQLWRNRGSVRAFVRRVPNVPELADAARVAVWAKPISLAFGGMALISGMLIDGTVAATIGLYMLGLIIWHRLYNSQNEVVTSVIQLILLYLQFIVAATVSILVIKGPLNGFVTERRIAIFLSVICILAALLSSIWIYASASSVISGNNVRPRQWGFMIFSWLISRTLVFFRRLFRFMPIIIIDILIFALIYWIVSLFLDKKIMNALRWFCIGCSVAVCVIILIRVIWATALFINDWNKMRKWLRAHSRDPGPDQLRICFESLATELCRAELLDRARVFCPLWVDNQTKSTIVSLIDGIERSIQELKSTQRKYIGDIEVPFWARGLKPFSLAKIMKNLDWSDHENYLYHQRDAAYLLRESISQQDPSGIRSSILTSPAARA
jgi:hypothetical protein